MKNSTIYKDKLHRAIQAHHLAEIDSVFYDVIELVEAFENEGCDVQNMPLFCNAIYKIIELIEGGHYDIAKNHSENLVKSLI